MIKLTSLFSGSRGNCTLLQADNINILLDLGYGYKSVLQKLRTLGISRNDINAIVITHEHSDHISALPYWTKYCCTPVYVPSRIANKIRAYSCCGTIKEITGSFFVDGVSVDIYECSHDAVCCFGYRFSYGGDCVASVTDTGCWNQDLVDFLSPCRTIQIESNHDVEMLKNGFYPHALKRRILSDYGHLSNAQTAALLEKLAGTTVKNIILAHLSEKNNSVEIAFACAVSAFEKHGLVEGRDIRIYVATQSGLEVTVD